MKKLAPPKWRRQGRVGVRYVLASALLIAAAPLQGGTSAFEENAGQLPESVRFVARAPGYDLFLGVGRIDIVVRGERDCAADSVHAIGMTFPGSRADAAPDGVGRQLGVSHYLRGSDPSRWIRGVARYDEVLYRDLYPGIDLRFRFGSGGIAHDFLLDPGADPSAIRMRFDGADAAELGASGRLVLETRLGDVVQDVPFVFHEGSESEALCASYVLRTDEEDVEARFDVRGHDPGRRLVIDPTVVFSTYLGGSYYDGAAASALDAGGSVYLTGVSNSPDFPIVGGYQQTNSSDDAIVVKLSPDGSSIVYSTFLGGGNEDVGYALDVDAAGNVYVAGWTKSGNFPTPGGPQTTLGGGWDGFAAMLDPTGAVLEYGTYLGGSAHDFANGIAVDATGSALVTGQTESADFPVVNPYQGSLDGTVDAFLAKIAPGGGAFATSTYFGGSSTEYGRGVSIDAAGGVWICGETYSSDFPFVGGAQSFGDGFATRFDAALATISYSTRLGGSGSCEPYGICAHPDGGAVVVGGIWSADMPTLNAFQGTFGGGDVDGFAVRVNGPAFEFATYLGGSDRDTATSVAIDASGAVTIAGWTSSPDFPTLDPSQPQYGGGFSDLFVTQLPATGVPGISSSYLGGSGQETVDQIVGVASTPQGDAVVAGFSYSDDYPLVNPLQAARAGFTDVVVTRIARSACGSIAIQPPALPPGRVGEAYAQSLTPSGGVGPYTFALTAGALPPGVVLSAAGAISGVPSSSGPFPFSVTATDATGCTGSRSYTLAIAPDMELLTAPGNAAVNPPRLRRFDRTGAPTGVDFLAYASPRWGARVSTGNVDSDAPEEILTGAGPGPGLSPHVRGFDDLGRPIGRVSFYAFGTSQHGVDVAASDVDGDGADEILAGAGPGSVYAPHVRAFDHDGGPVALLAKVSFYAFASFRYGVHVAGGDVDADGFDEILTGAGPGPANPARARGFDYDATRLAAIPGFDAIAFPSSFGVELACGDVDLDGVGELVVGTGPDPGGSARIRGFDYAGNALSPLPGFDADVDPTARYGAIPGAGDIASGLADELVACAGPDPAASASVLAFAYDGVALVPVALTLDAYPGLRYGARAATTALAP